MPLFDSPDLIRRIAEFIAACDSHAKRSAVERGNAEFVTGTAAQDVTRHG